jgi:hypothetical protein
LVRENQLIAALKRLANELPTIAAGVAKAYAELPRFTLPPLEPGSYIYVTHPWSSPSWPETILVVKRTDGRLNLWRIATVDGHYLMPDRSWWRIGGMCRDLSPDFAAETISCKDPDAPRKFDHYVWSLDGQRRTDAWWVPDLMPIRGKQELGQIVLYHPDAR